MNYFSVHFQRTTRAHDVWSQSSVVPESQDGNALWEKFPMSLISEIVLTHKVGYLAYGVVLNSAYSSEKDYRIRLHDGPVLNSTPVHGVEVDHGDFGV